MTKEDIKKEAEGYARNLPFVYETDVVKRIVRERVKLALIDVLEPREKHIAELEKKNAELTCQIKRNFYCYSCKNATEKCYRKEIGCPCGKYESYKDENAELKEHHRNVCENLTNTHRNIREQLTKAKEIIKNLHEVVRILNNTNVQLTDASYTLAEAEQFLDGVHNGQ